MPSFTAALPSLNTTEDLCKFLGLSEFALKRFCLRPRIFYSTFERPKKTGGTRTICAPAEDLKTVQRKIKEEILDKIELHPACMGYRPGRSIVSNAELHVGQRCLLNMDIKDFFQSISTARVAGVFCSLGYAEDIAIILARLCCFENALPQGAPSSPALANVVCHKLDRRLAGLAQARKMNYSRYCDDITLSGSGRFNRQTVDFFKSIILDEGFKVNEKKTRLLSSRACQTVTGLSVNAKVNIPRKRKRQIRAIIHQAQLTPMNQQKSNQINGLKSFLNMVSTQPLLAD